MRPLLFFIIMMVSHGAFSAEEATYSMELQASAERDKLNSLYLRNRQMMEEGLIHKHIGLEILIADSYAEKIESSFGHALIRLIDQNDDPYDDLVIGFEMQNFTPESRYTKAYFSGGAENVPMVFTLIDVIRNYVIRERRPLTRVILPSTPEQISRLKKIFFKS